MCGQKKKKKKIAFKLNFKVKAYYSVSSNLQNTNEENNIIFFFFLWTIGLDQEGNEYEKKKLMICFLSTSNTIDYEKELTICFLSSLNSIFEFIKE